MADSTKRNGKGCSLPQKTPNSYDRYEWQPRKDSNLEEVSLSLELEKTEDGVTWTAYEGGTWTETAGGKFTLSFPLTETKNWVRLALKE